MKFITTLLKHLKSHLLPQTDLQNILSHSVLTCFAFCLPLFLRQRMCSYIWNKSGFWNPHVQLCRLQFISCWEERSELMRRCRQWFDQIKTFLYVLWTYPVMSDIVVCHRQNEQWQIEALISNLFIIYKHYCLHNRGIIVLFCSDLFCRYFHAELNLIIKRVREAVGKYYHRLQTKERKLIKLAC